MELNIDTQGVVRCVYHEAIDLAALGSIAIQRASHVEPTKDGQWTADLSPVAGPILGPFAVRSEALAAEYDWLNTNWLPSSKSSAFLCPHCSSRVLAYTEYVQRMYRRCQEENGVLICHAASDAVHWEESKDPMLYCRQCGQRFPVPAGRDIDFV